MSTQPPDPTSSAAPHPAYAAGPATSSFQPQPQPQGAHAPAPVAAPVDVKKARALTMPYRELAAFVLLGVAGAFLLAGFIALLTTLTDQFLNNAGGAFSAFVSIETVALPILAVLLATHLDPVVPKAKLIVLIALIEYAVAALFGLVMLLASLIGDLRGEGVPMGPVLAVFLTRLGTLSLLGLGLFLVIRVYLGAYAPPKPPRASTASRRTRTGRSRATSIPSSSSTRSTPATSSSPARPRSRRTSSSRATRSSSR